MLNLKTTILKNQINRKKNMQYDAVMEYVTEAREHSLDLMHEADDAQHFYFYQGKVMAFSEVMRELEEQCK